MEKIPLILAAIVLAAVTASAAPQQAQNPCNPCAKKAQNPCAKKAKNPCNPCAKKGQNPCAAKSANVKGGNRTIIGFIGDSQCGLAHKMNMGDDKACTLKCVEGGGKFILADRAHKVVYALDDAAQERAREFAGKKVKVTGNVDAQAKSIVVTKIETA
jgi:hypothetical protein